MCLNENILYAKHIAKHVWLFHLVLTTIPQGIHQYLYFINEEIEALKRFSSFSKVTQLLSDRVTFITSNRAPEPKYLADRL